MFVIWACILLLIFGAGFFVGVCACALFMTPAPKQDDERRAHQEF